MGHGEHIGRNDIKAAEEESLKKKNNKDEEGNDERSKQGTWQKLPLVCFIFTTVNVILLIANIVLIIHRATRAETCSSTEEKITYVQRLDGWIIFGDKYYYLSDTYETWKNSQKYCKEHDSSLAIIDNKEELKFLMQIKGDDNRWIGLSRTENNNGWIWANGTPYSENIFPIDRLYKVNGQSECVYLNQYGVKSRKEDFVTKWICSKNLLLKPC